MSQSIVNTLSPQPNLSRNRLPTLSEVLCRQTLPPVDLHSFGIFMRHQQRPTDYLEFWLHASQHLSLCRHYLRTPGQSVLVETPELERPISAVSSFVLGQMGDRTESSSPSEYIPFNEMIRDANNSECYLLGPVGEVRNQPGTSTHFQCKRKIDGANASVWLRGGDIAGHSIHASLASHPSGLQGAGNRSFNSRIDRPPASSSSSNHMFANNMRAHIRASAEKIVYTFLLPGAEQEILLPQFILSNMITSIEEERRDDPEVFERARQWAFQAMERDAFPGFLRSKALGNLVQPSLYLRLCIGLLGMFGGFWAGFICIFLDKPKYIRCWVILPFLIGAYCIFTQKYGVDPVLAVAGLSENSFASWSPVREPYVQQMISKRALMVLVFTILFGVSFIVLFIFVPGKRI